MILQNKTQSNFTMINNAIFRDKSLSIKERGVLCTVCSFPTGWDFSIRGLATLVPDGVDAIRAAIKGLEEKGYLVRNMQRDKDGKYTTVLQIDTLPYGKNRDGKSDTDNPIRENRDGLSDTEEPTQYNTDNTKLNINTEHLISISQNENYADKKMDGRRPIKLIDMRNLGNEGNEPEEYVRETYMTRNSPDDNTRETYRQLIAKNIDLPSLKEIAQRRGDAEQKMVDEIYEVICDMVCYKREKVTIRGTEYPWEAVRSRFLKLTFEHVAGVLNKIVDKELGIKNMESYLVSALYSASLVGTIESQADLHDDYLKSLRGDPYKI